jgi:hypothetical protein
VGTNYRSGVLQQSGSGKPTNNIGHSSVVARSHDILKTLVLEAKRMYEKDAEHRVHIFMSDS